MFLTRSLAVALIGSGFCCPQIRAASPVWVTRVIGQLPKTADEVAAAHEASKLAAVQVPVGDPLQVAPYEKEVAYNVTVREGSDSVKRTVRFDYGRINALTYGMEVAPDDQKNLPSVSRNRILGRVNGNYIGVQVRAQRDRDTHAIYLHYQPYAVVGGYGQDNTQEFAPLMESSVRDFRGLGMFVKDGTPPSAEAFRTFVAVSQDRAVVVDEATGDEQMVPWYEYVFVRARVEGDALALHTFVTREERTLLDYLQPYAPPASADECSVKSTILFTDYTVAKQSPSEKATREARVLSQATLPMEKVHQYAADQGWKGDGLDNLTETLDAVIDGKLR